MGLGGASDVAALPSPALAATGMAVVVPRLSSSSSFALPVNCQITQAVILRPFS